MASDLLNEISTDRAWVYRAGIEGEETTKVGGSFNPGQAGREYRSTFKVRRFESAIDITWKTLPQGTTQPSELPEEVLAVTPSQRVTFLREHDGKADRVTFGVDKTFEATQEAFARFNLGYVLEGYISLDGRHDLLALLKDSADLKVRAHGKPVLGQEAVEVTGSTPIGAISVVVTEKRPRLLLGYSVRREFGPGEKPVEAAGRRRPTEAIPVTQDDWALSTVNVNVTELKHVDGLLVAAKGKFDSRMVTRTGRDSVNETTFNRNEITLLKEVGDVGKVLLPDGTPGYPTGEGLNRNIAYAIKDGKFVPVVPRIDNTAAATAPAVSAPGDISDPLEGSSRWNVLNISLLCILLAGLGWWGIHLRRGRRIHENA